jgi:SAM-dependent methyltransferase
MSTGDGAATTALVERLFGAALGGFDLLCVHIGDRLGLYAALADGPPGTAAEIAERAGIHPRYAREWLEQQALTGIITTRNPEAPDDERRYELPPAHVPALLDETSMDFIAPIAQLFAACAKPVDPVIGAFRSGGGVPYAEYGEDLHEGQARFSRLLFDNVLTEEWLPSITEVHARLQADPPARIADLACGLGHSTLAMARGYPKVIADGIDLDRASIDAAERIRAGAEPEITSRVSFRCANAADVAAAGEYDLVTIFEALHDMSDPVSVLRAARALLAPGGLVLIGDERVADRFRLDAGEVELLYYGFSVTHCLPVGMVGDDPAGTGTVMRTDTLRGYARAAGFSALEVLPVENEFWRLYLLRP